MKPTALWRGSVALLLIALTLIGTLLGTAWRRSHPRRDRPRLVVTFLDVGDGDCTLVRSPEGRTILLDAGSAQAGPSVVDALRRRNVRTIDLLILTSPDEASIGGVPALLESGIGVSQVWDNPVADTGEARRDALEAIRRHIPHIPSSTANGGDAIQVGQMLFVSAIWPPGSGPASRRDPLVCRINYGGTAFLFEAAATAESERDLISQAGRQIECTGACTDMILQIAGDAAAGDPGHCGDLLRAGQCAHAGDAASLAGGRSGGLADRHAGDDHRHRQWPRFAGSHGGAFVRTTAGKSSYDLCRH